ncbi:hypothetical protein ACIOWI_01700 [Streptomyces sp. NPDC087659]|uniref:hypothetical protein n=1 Tax=Streptomyces TaxID=1883 RepID=UPI0025B61E95|nr:hypothetical protein [Streptomyces sp. HUAS CB01]WJY50193.1 hypothetical protein QRN89_10385 [Streptomyces sp. HUAS CB01]WJY50198.1 hypothetical protein QRN89_10410 [Streptomyces sp. HUAS CB01]
MISRVRRRLIAGLIGTFTALAGVTTLAFASTPASPATAGTAGDTPPFAVEDFTYPNAAKILADKGILLKKGDGHIVLAECGQSANQIQVMTVKDPAAGRDEMYCFQANSTSGYLTLELPRVFAIGTGDHPVKADLTANGQTTTVTIPEDGFESVGEGTVGGPQSVLVELRVTG